MDDIARNDLLRLVAKIRWAALATVNSDATPLVSNCAFARAPDPQALLFHLSTLARHTRNLAERPRCALGISDTDDGREDPQTLARVTLTGEMSRLSPDHPDYRASANAYLARLPLARPRFEFGDFHLFTLRIDGGQYVGGFARAFSVRPEDLAPPT